VDELERFPERKVRELAGVASSLRLALRYSATRFTAGLTFQGVAHSDHVAPETRYAKKDGVHIAYQMVGEGTLDLLLVSSWFSHVEARWEIPAFAHYLRRLSSFSRLISFDKQGMGLSDPIALDRLPPLEEWMDDVRAVLDAVGCQRVAVMGVNEGSLMAALFAATYPERVTALILGTATGRSKWATDHPWGPTAAEVEALVGLVERSWGTREVYAALNPSLVNDPNALDAYARFFRQAASPAVAAAVTRMLLELDIRDVLPAISAPTLVVHRRGNPVVPPEAGREVARRIPGAKFVEVPGVDYGFAVGDVDVVIDEVEEFLTGSRPRPASNRVLSTILFTDIVDSTVRAVELGDARWRGLLEAHEALCGREVKTFGGVVSDFAGDGVLATFDGPARAVHCALALRDELRSLGLGMRAGLHTGEIERRGDRVAGIGVHIASRILSLAKPGEVLVSRTVRDLVSGSGLKFIDHGTYALNGVPDEWQVLAATT
jgi:class 3 adenylate cyclase